MELIEGRFRFASSEAIIANLPGKGEVEATLLGYANDTHGHVAVIWVEGETMLNLIHPSRVKAIK